MNSAKILPTLLAFGGAPLLLGIIARTKAVVAGRRGQPLLQAYYDIAKLLRKGAVYSRTTSWVFRAGPVVGAAATILAVTLVPLGGVPSLIGFSGDVLLFASVLGLLRLFTVLAALDTGSSFEGMGASREVAFAALAEPTLLLGLAVLAHQTGSLSLSAMYGAIGPNAWSAAAPPLVLLAAAFVIVLLAENARIPVDDPTTHLELTMIHEVMVLDHGGPDLALITYGAALKLWLFAALVVGLVVPVRTGTLYLDLGAILCGMIGLAVIIGLIESAMARWRLVRVPQLLIGSGALTIIALLLLVE